MTPSLHKKCRPVNSTNSTNLISFKTSNDTIKRFLPSQLPKDSWKISISVQSQCNSPAWYTDSRSCTVEFRASSRVAVALAVGWLVLYWGYTDAIVCKLRDVNRQTCLQIICTYMWVRYMRYVSDFLVKTK